MEAAAQKSKALKGSHRSNAVLAVDTPVPGRICDRCGRGNHNNRDCKFKGATCHNCGKVGHIAPVCRSKPSRRPPKSTGKRKWLATESGHSLAQPDPVPLFVIQDRSSSPYLVELKVNGQPLTMEVDTPVQLYPWPRSQLWPCYSLLPLSSHLT